MNLPSQYNELKMKAVQMNGELHSNERGLKENLVIRAQLEQERNQVVAQISDLEEAITKFKIIIEKFSRDHIKEVESLITLALRTVFYDKDYALKIKVTDKRNNKYAELYLIDEGVEVPLYNGQVAGGVRSVMGLIFQIYTLSYLDLAPILFLDEALSQISDQYLPGVFEFIDRLREKNNLTLVLITHDMRFREYAQRVYRVEDGKYTLIQG